MPFVVETDVASDQGKITLFGAKGVVLALYGLANLIKRFLRALFHDCSCKILTYGDVTKYNH